MSIPLGEIAKLVDGIVLGDDSLIIRTLSPVDDIEADALVFAEGEDNIRLAEASNAAAILVTPNVSHTNKSIIQVPSPFKAFIKLINHFYPQVKAAEGVHPTAVIAEDVVIGQHASIGPYVVIGSGTVIGDDCVVKSHVHIGNNVTIGNNTTIHPHVTLYDNSKLGARVQIHASTVIGADGFGYINEAGQHIKVPHAGCVIIEDDVEIGSNAVIDRATLGATHIGEGTKIDNLVQVAHSVKLGKHNILCGFTGVAGSTTSGDHVIFAANVGVSDHVRIESGVILGARAGVPSRKHLKEGNVYLGNPARPKEKAIEQELSTARIPVMRKNIKELTDKLLELTERLEVLEKETITE